jgi:hypothetical protein
MLTTVIATVLLLLAKNHSSPVQQPVVSAPKPVTDKEAPPPPPNLHVSATTMYKNNLSEELSIDQYNTMLRPLFVRSPDYILAELLLNKYLQQLHVDHMTDFDPRPRDENQIQTYRKMFNSPEGPRLWQITAIGTKYGHIYLSLRLNDDGTIPVATIGILITYDVDEIGYFITRTSGDQEQRFGRIVFQDETTVNSEDLLRLFLGDEHYPHSINTYFIKNGEKHY